MSVQKTLTKPLNVNGLFLQCRYKFVEAQSVGCVDFQIEGPKSLRFHFIFICVSKTNKRLLGLERHEGK